MQKESSKLQTMENREAASQTNTDGRRPVYIASFPTPADDTYYFWLYYEALAKLGYELANTRGVTLTEEWLEKNAGKIDIIHFHWPAYIYSKKNFKDFYHSLIHFVRLLRKAKSLKYTIAWTVHNIFPHERNNLVLEYAARFCLARLADVLFVHFKEAKATVGKRFFRFKDIHEIPHGNFFSVFQNNCTREEARTRLNIPVDSFVYLVFGPVRPYKGIEEALDAFERTATAKDVLLVVGNCSDEKTGKWLTDKAEADPRIVPHLRFVPKDEVEFFFNASDVVLLPYKKIFTSGNLFLAFTFGKPVICPDMGIISEVVDSNVGIMYKPSQDSSALAEAMRGIKNLDYDKACAAAFGKARSFTWEEAAIRSEQAFRQCSRK